MSRFNVTALPMNMRNKIMVSFSPALTHGSACWEWTGAVQSSGYGSTAGGRKGISALAHRMAYRHIVGEIPAGLTIDHLCFNKICVNTDHMEVVTRAENNRRKHARQTHCKQGHLLGGENLRLVTRRNGWEYRVCKECAMKQSRAANARTTARRREVLPRDKWRIRAAA